MALGTTTALTWTCTSISDANGRVCTEVDNSTAEASKVLIYHTIQGGTAPGTDKLYKYYIVRRDAATQNYDSDGVTSGSDAAVSTLPLNAEPVHSIEVINSLNGYSYADFVIWNPGPYWALIFWNASGQTTNATGTNNVAQYLTLD